jgi:uncharacterized protein YbdZ (MbtH family)
MPYEEDEDTRTYRVVVNGEEQYSIYLADRELPAGWRDVGTQGPKQECLAYIEKVWTDMRPLSLRKHMDEWKNAPAPAPPAVLPRPRHPLGMDDLVERLGEPQEVEAGLRPERRAKLLKEQIDRGHVFMRFVKTGTELGIRLDAASSDWSSADFVAETGSVKIVGDLVLNYNRVRYHGDLDLATLRGTGRLEFLGEVGRTASS